MMDRRAFVITGLLSVLGAPPLRAQSARLPVQIGFLRIVAPTQDFIEALEQGLVRLERETLHRAGGAARRGGRRSGAPDARRAVLGRLRPSLARGRLSRPGSRSDGGRARWTVGELLPAGFTLSR